MADAIWRKTLKEVDAGTMSGPYSLEAMLEKHGKYLNLVPSFGLKQGEKYRRIDDHSASHNNLAAERMQQIHMAMVDYLMVMISSMAKKFNTGLHVATEDMAGAYRQVPLTDSQVGISVTAVYNPKTKQPDLFEIYGQPFGAARAVPNFYRVAEWACRLVVRAYGMLVDHFFDGCFAVVRPKESETSIFCLKEAFKLLGLVLDVDKSQPPSDFAHVLGVAFNTRSLRAQRLLLVEPKASRVANLVSLVDKVLADNFLSPSLAASLLGKFGFLCSTMFGKVGRCCTQSIRARQYGNPDEITLTRDIRVSLNLMKLFATTAPSRQLTLDAELPPLILYTALTPLTYPADPKGAGPPEQESDGNSGGLVPKKACVDDGAQFRPIVCGEVFLKLAARLATARLVATWCVPSSCFGSVPGHGLPEALYILRHAAQTSALFLDDTAFVQLDLSQAFDSLRINALLHFFVQHWSGLSAKSASLLRWSLCFLPAWGEDVDQSICGTLGSFTCYYGVAATKLWNGESLKAVKTSLVDDDVTTLLYREADNALMDAAVLYLPSREVVTSPKFTNFFQSMGDRLVIMTNTENAAANWRVENMGADFYDNPDVGLEICKVFAQQSYYYQLVPINNWQVTFFRAYPFPWELWIEDLNYNLVKLGESEQKPSYEQILAWTEAYEESVGIRAFQKVGKLLQDNQQRLDPDDASFALSAS
eukprot:s178_g32.t1